MLQEWLLKKTICEFELFRDCPKLIIISWRNDNEGEGKGTGTNSL